MIPCYGTHGSRQQINNKSIQEKYKMYVLVAEASSDQSNVQRKENILPALLNGGDDKTLLCG